MGAAECVKTVGVPTCCAFRGGLRGGRRTFSAVRLKAPISMRLAPDGSCDKGQCHCIAFVATTCPSCRTHRCRQVNEIWVSLHP